jgi:hypothetical protein
MVRRQWLFVVPALLLVGGSGWRFLNPAASRAADRRIADERLFELEKERGQHMYAPTWLPHGGRVGAGTRVGRHRILQDFADKADRSIAILAQEARNEERDTYHRKRFMNLAEAKAEVNGKPGFFVTGSSGERRLFWMEQDAALILSSNVLTDEELVLVAHQVR